MPRFKRYPEFGDVSLAVIYAKKFPDRFTARALVAQAVRSGSLVRMPCEVCGAERAEGHHADYSKPLDVRWLCRLHHLAEHRLLREAEYARRATCPVYLQKQADMKMAYKAKARSVSGADTPERVQRAKDRLEKSHQRKAKAADLIGRGATLTEMAASFGISLSAASHYLRRNKINRNAS